MIKIKSLLDLEISKKGCYELKKPEELGKDDIIPIVSDVMFKIMLGNEKGEILTNKIKIMHLYLPKIKEKYYNKEKLSELEKIILVFNLSNKNELDNIIGDNKIMKEYKKEALDASHDEEVIGLYDKELEDFYNRQAAYYEIEEKAMKEGLEKGIKKGIEQDENKKSIEIAKIMLDKNMDISLISEITKLSKEEIENCN